MEAIFLKLLNISLTASYLVLAVALVRILFKKAPKWAICLLWGVVALRLICPFNIESIFSLIPNAEPIPQDILLSKAPAVNTGVAALDKVINPILSATSTPNLINSINPLQVVAFVATWIWIAGMSAMAIYALVSYFKIRWQVRESVRLYNNVWVSDRIRTPFILGLLRPRVYLPHALSENDTQYVLQHEKAHLKRLDHVWKPMGFALLTVYWFNPLLWVAYILLCRDIEMACDEKVLRQLGTEGKKPYADALINCSVPRRSIAACPLAFGEGDVKKRIRSILHYKKPAFWIIAATLAVCICISVAFLTNPKTVITGLSQQEQGTTLNGVNICISDADLTSSDPYIDLKWENRTLKTIVCSPHIQLYRQENGQWERFDTQLSTEDPASLAPGQTITQRLALLCRDFSNAGRYRLETAFHPADKQIEDQSQLDSTWVAFSLDEGVEPMSSTWLQCMQRIAWEESGNTADFMSAIDSFRLVSNSEGLWLHALTEDGATVLGCMQEFSFVPSAYEKIDSRTNALTWSAGWTRQFLKGTECEKIDSFITNPETGEATPIIITQENGSFFVCSRAWELYYSNPQTGEKELYVLLQKPEGEYFLCVGYYDYQGNNLSNPDNSCIVGVYSMSAVPNFAGGVIGFIVTQGG